MMLRYQWAANSLKLDRAIRAAQGGSEEAIKEEYRKLGGLVIDVKPSPQVERQEVADNNDTPEVSEHNDGTGTESKAQEQQAEAGSDVA